MRHSNALQTLWPTHLSAPGLLAILNKRPAWHEQAACSTSDVEFFPDEGGSARGKMAAAAQLAPVLVCERCPVRRPCLEAGLETWRFAHDAVDVERGGKKSADISTVARSVGIWGATTALERWHVRDLGVTEAADLLEATMERRVEARITAWKALVDARIGSAVGRHTRHDKIIVAILAERGVSNMLDTATDVKRFPWHLQAAGPGRGHRGPIALLAEELGCSRSTAWRRLRAAA